MPLPYTQSQVDAVVQSMQPMVTVQAPQTNVAVPTQDSFFTQAASPANGMVVSANADPMYREAPIANPNYNMPGSAEAYARWGIPPVMVQRDPYATVAWQANGDGSVTPLIGFGSRYPHVVNGVPRQVGSAALGNLLGGLMNMANRFIPPLPVIQRRAAGGGNGGGGNGDGGNGTTRPHVNVVPDDAIPGPTIPPPEVRYAGAGYVPPSVANRFIGKGPTATSHHNAMQYAPPASDVYTRWAINPPGTTSTSAQPIPQSQPLSQVQPGILATPRPAVDSVVEPYNSTPSAPVLAPSHPANVHPADTAAVMETLALARQLQQVMGLA